MGGPLTPSITRLLVAGSVLVLVVVWATYTYLPATIPVHPSAPGQSPADVNVWSKASYQGEFVRGMNQTAPIRVPEIPGGTGTVYVDASLSTDSWILYTNGLFNQSGNCANSFSPPGACNVFVGIWTAASWAAYTRGGPMDPLWCFPGGGGPCQNVSGGSFVTPNLPSLAGLGWEIHVWNLDPYALSGSYTFTVYASAPSR
ncbi:MAG TPA: hypothetical protein VGV64_06935 [Thermoplasmata archaeon]|nr:hypothetical protein [Thermoplasmata archaeon]